MPSIKVVARFRPINKRELEEQAANGWDSEYTVPVELEENDNGVLTTVIMNSTGDPKTNPRFVFDRILWWDTTQEKCFEVVGKPAVEDVVAGFSSTIFVYGQTGSGKSFSVFGVEPTEENPLPPPELMGLIPRCIDYIFEWVDQNKKAGKISKVVCELAVFEIYIHNKMKDLLHPAPPKAKNQLKIRDGRRGVYIENLKREKVESTTDVLQLSVVAQANRTISKTKMNSVSSRSHCIFEMNVSYLSAEGQSVTAKMNFADLAGSEKVRKTGAKGKALEEAKAINASLTVLGNCIAAIVKGNNPPFRESALAHCLKTSLSGNCKTTLVVAASPHRFNLTETINSFQFASRAKMIKTKAKANTTMSPAQMKKEIQRLKGVVKELKINLSKSGGGTQTSGVEIQVVWEGTDVPEEKERKAAQNEMKKYVLDILENELDEQSDLILDVVGVEINKEKPYTSVISFYPDDQCDEDECKKYRNLLYEYLKNDSTGPFSKNTSIITHDPISPAAFEAMQKKVQELEDENKELRDEISTLNNASLETKEQLRSAQEALQATSDGRMKDRAKFLLSSAARGLAMKERASKIKASALAAATTNVNLDMQIDTLDAQIESEKNQP